jgi:glycine hydroxymethyltransferase
MPKDYLVRGRLADVDPEIAELVRHETARQQRYLIMIPSESTIPEAVREAVGSSFINLYAEGYPLESTRTMSQEALLDYNARLTEYRRHADLRYYKGSEYANVAESVARRRCAEVFATPDTPADSLFVNVQPLSGAPANSAVYTALLQPGDTILSMSLTLGGHLSHGAPVARSGKTYTIVSYGLNPDTEAIDYEAMRELAVQHKPKILIGGYSSYPLLPDWQAYRRIADEVGAILLADIAHFAGMVAAGVYPSPVGIADIVTFTTHKTLNGPRGAVIITHRADLAPKLDRGVFPGEQGGPHVNQIVGLAVALKIATSDDFKALQAQTVANAKRLAERLKARGFRIPHGGTDAHMHLLDCKTVKGADGTALNGEMAARILDLVGVVCNRQTIPGDSGALNPTGIRLGTPWITQRGFGIAEIDALAEIIADVLQACEPYTVMNQGKREVRAKIDFDTLQTARTRVRQLSDSVGIDTHVVADGYPHFHYIDDAYNAGWHSFDISGERVQEFLHTALTSDVYALNAVDRQQITNLLEVDGRTMASGVLEYVSEKHYRLHLEENVARVAAWLRSLSDGFVRADAHDITLTLPVVDVAYHGETESILASQTDAHVGYADKTFFIGMSGAHYNGNKGADLPPFVWQEPAQESLLKTPLHSLHVELGAKLAPFAGYDMPLWYDSVMNEHLAVRQRAGVFDVSHMGVWEAKGMGAVAFLHALTTNDVQRLKVGMSHYTFLLDIDGKPFDDLLIYRLDVDHFFIVVNASNDAKNWAWANAVKEGRVRVDNALAWRTLEGRNDFVLRDLRAESSGADRRVDLALQGKQSKDILLSFALSDSDRAKLESLSWAGITRVQLGAYDVIVSRTGYTGERTAYELFPHPDHASALFRDLIAKGATPCGLASRDSLRIEAGLPLYGHELAGDLNLSPADAGMGNYVKTSKPFFVGKQAYMAHDTAREGEIVRFRFDSKAGRMAHPNDPVFNAKGERVGTVTSCSRDSEGYRIGLAYVKHGNRKLGSALSVAPGASEGKQSTPEAVTVLSRMMK